MCSLMCVGGELPEVLQVVHVRKQWQSWESLQHYEGRGMLCRFLLSVWIGVWDCIPGVLLIGGVDGPGMVTTHRLLGLIGSWLLREGELFDQVYIVRHGSLCCLFTDGLDFRVNIWLTVFFVGILLCTDLLIRSGLWLFLHRRMGMFLLASGWLSRPRKGWWQHAKLWRFQRRPLANTMLRQVSSCFNHGPLVRLWARLSAHSVFIPGAQICCCQWNLNLIPGDRFYALYLE